MTPHRPKTCFEGPPGDVLNQPRTPGYPLDVRLRSPMDVISGRPQDVRSRRPRDGQIGSLEDVLGTLEGDVLRTSWGPIFAGWEDFKIAELLLKYPFFFTLETVLKMAKETNKGDVESICARVTKPASKKVANAEVDLN